MTTIRCVESETLRVRTALLDVEVQRWGPRDGAPVLLLHGWPDSLLTWSSLAEDRRWQNGR